MRSGFIGIVAFLLMSGCAATELCPATPGGDAVEHITLRSPGNFEQMALQGGRMFGPDLEVMRYDDAYRGKAFRKHIDLRVQEDLIEGVIDSGRTVLHIERFPDGFALQGMYAGHLGQLTLRRDRLEGHLGGRVFRLRSTATDPLVYESSSGPAEQATPVAGGGSPMQPGHRDFPSGGVGALPTGHQAAVLAIFRSLTGLTEDRLRDGGRCARRGGCATPGRHSRPDDALPHDAGSLDDRAVAHHRSLEDGARFERDARSRPAARCRRSTTQIARSSDAG
jgi:hypothetical protein